MNFNMAKVGASSPTLRVLNASITPLDGCTSAALTVSQDLQKMMLRYVKKLADFPLFPQIYRVFRTCQLALSESTLTLQVYTVLHSACNACDALK
jgi:hypothetical protein